jgi:hypothetical protein
MDWREPFSFLNAGVLRQNAVGRSRLIAGWAIPLSL